MDEEDHTPQQILDPLKFDGSSIFSREAADFSFLRPLKPTLLFTVFWRFAAERQRVFWRRVAGMPLPWTGDPVLAAYKFTNAYRASDRVSQYLIRSVQYEGAQEARELFFRTLLFKLFNRIETWQLLQREAGLLHTDVFCVERYDRVLTAAPAPRHVDLLGGVQHTLRRQGCALCPQAPDALGTAGKDAPRRTAGAHRWHGDDGAGICCPAGLSHHRRLLGLSVSHRPELQYADQLQ